AARVKQALQLKPAVVILELGANDGLRGLPLTATRSNLAAMIDQFHNAGAKVLLAGITLPRNYGPVYADRFTKVFGEVAQQRKVPLVPFLMAGLVAEHDRWFQDDGIHPNASAQPQLLDAVWPTLAPLLQHATHP
ncbi:MAG: GDSL-type esterase/lipase family protein, partial [Nevskiales bacterium]